jgi:hypothetical protein
MEGPSLPPTWKGHCLQRRCGSQRFKGARGHRAGFPDDLDGVLLAAPRAGTGLEREAMVTRPGVHRAGVPEIRADAAGGRDAWPCGKGELVFAPKQVWLCLLEFIPPPRIPAVPRRSADLDEPDPLGRRAPCPGAGVLLPAAPCAASPNAALQPSAICGRARWCLGSRTAGRSPGTSSPKRRRSTRRAVGEMPGRQLLLRGFCHSNCHSPRVRYPVLYSKKSFNLEPPYGIEP